MVFIAEIHCSKFSIKFRTFKTLKYYKLDQHLVSSQYIIKKAFTEYLEMLSLTLK